MHSLRWSLSSAAARRLAACTLASVLGGACGGLEKNIPPGYTALEEVNVATFPPAEGAVTYPEKILFVNGRRAAEGDKQGYDWAHGRGYIHAPIQKVWAALKDPDVVADRRQSANWIVESTEQDMTAHRSFQVRFNTNSTPSVSFVQAWRQRAVAGTLEMPARVIVRDDLVAPAEFFGIILMQQLSDSVIVEEIDDNTTSYEGIRHRASLQGGPADAQQYQADLYGSVVARVHDAPLPKY